MLAVMATAASAVIQAMLAYPSQNPRRRSRARSSLCGAADDPDAGAEDLTPAEARELAAALLEAAQIAE